MADARVADAHDAPLTDLLSTTTRVRRFDGATSVDADDFVAIESPLEIKLAASDRATSTLSITMRTPGHDRDLAAGFLLTEGIVRAPGDLVDVVQVAEDSVVAHVRAGLEVSYGALDRHVYTTSSCGVCGKTSLDAVRTTSFFAIEAGPTVRARDVGLFPERLRARQATFARTGGLHAAGLFSSDGTLLDAREDVGRHNAVDKLFGAALATRSLPLASSILMLSGRASFELIQKARMAGVAFVAAVGAPSSLAIELARAESMTLLGFVRDDRFNVYAGADRVV
jgi:FdhD protein